MYKIWELKNKIFDFLKNHNYIKYIVFTLVFFFLLFVIYYFNKDRVDDVLSKNFSSFEVSAWNFDLWIKKLPYNTKSIDVSFSKDLDEVSIMKWVFKITPEVPWVLKLKDKNTISYELSGNLKIGQDYTITLSKTIKSFVWEPLEDDLVYIISAVAWARVIKVLPEKKLDEVTKNMSVFFSIPMVTMTDLDSRDALPCPIDITPKVDADCKWTTTSVVELIPKKWFAWSTKYDYTISSKSWMVFELEKNITWSFLTPELSLITNDTFVPKKGVELNFNYPVDENELSKKIILKTLSWSSKIEIKTKIEKIKDSETSFIIKKDNWDFTYDTNYELTVKSSLKPKYGNIALNSDFNKYINSTSLISYNSIYKNIYSNSWVLINNKDFSWFPYIPNKGIFFNIYFYEEISLNKDMFIFKNNKTGKSFDFDINYIKEEKEEKWVKTTQDNKMWIKLELNEKLENNSEYSLIISKKANSSLLEDIVYTYKTSPELKVNSFKFVNYSKSCLYVNNDLDNLVDENLNSWDNLYFENGKKFVSLSNSWIIKSFSLWDYISDWNFSESIKDLSQKEKNKKLLNAWYCPEAATGEIMYSVQTRLAPNSSFNLKFSSLVDIYGNTLKNDYIENIKSWNLKDTDKFVYLAYNNDTNVYPKNVPVIANIQTINSKNLEVELCEMDERNYISFLASRYNNSNPKCNKKTSKELETKLVYWKITNNKFDLEKDILSWKFAYDYIFLKVTTWDKEVSNIIVRTNASLFVEKAENKSLLFATDLQIHKEIEWLNLEFYDYNGKTVNIPYKFDKNKKVYVIDNSLSGISYIVAKNALYSWIVLDNDSFSNYDFKYISGQDSSQKDFAYVYSDRPIYRPWDEVQIKGLLREFKFDWYKKSWLKSWTLKLIWDDYSVYRSLDIKVDKNSNFTWSFIIPKDSQLWNFRFQFTYKIPWNEYDIEIYTNWWLSIEAYRKPSFKVEIESQKNDLVLWDKVNFKITPKYYFGWKLVNTNWFYSVLSQNYFFDGKEYSDYQFWEWNNYFDCVYWWYCNYGDHLNSWVNAFKINENWEFTLDYEFSKDKKDSEKIYTFNFEVNDPDTWKTVSNSVSKVLHNTDWYVWLKANYYNNKEKWIYIQTVTLDYNAKPLAYKSVGVEVFKKEYKQVKKLWVDGVFYNEYSSENKLENSFTLLNDDKWLSKYNVKTKDTWEYEIRVSYTWNNWKSFSSIQTVYVAWNDYISWWNDNNTITELEADKITYKIWEKAIFTLKSPVNNWKALIVLEKDDGILDYFVHDIKSYWDKIELKLSDKHYPNVYLKAYLIWSQNSNPLPVYKRALSVVKVLTEYKKLNIWIITDKKNYNPADKMQVTIEVTDSNWKVVPNANWSLSIVDESVLALKWNPKKNPYSFFYDMKRYLWVISYSNLKYLVEKLEVKDVSWWEKWWAWDMVKGWETKKPRWNFKDTAFWLSDFTTDASGKAVINIPVMPDNLTTWVLEALVTTPEDNKIWVNYETVMTSKEVMIDDNLPRFLGTDDTIVFSPVIYNRTWKSWDFEVSIEATNGNLKETKKTINLSPWESKKVEFSFDTLKSVNYKSQEISQIRIKAISKLDNSKLDEIVKKLPINLWTISEDVSTVWKTSDVSSQEKINLSNISKKEAKLTLDYSATLFTYLLDGIDYLSAYPYWCAEQKTSVIMPNVYIKKLYDVSWKEFDFKKKFIKKYINNEVWYKEISLDEVIKDYLSEIKKFQNDDWWFMYWYDSLYKYSDTHLTSYILSSLSQIKSLWYSVDKKVLENAKNYLVTEFYKKPTCSEKVLNNCVSLENKTEILKALNIYNSNDYEVYKMFKTLNTSKLSKLDDSYILANMSKISSVSKLEKDLLTKKAINIVNEILSNELVFNPKWAFISSDSHSRIYNTTKLLEVMWILWVKNFSDNETITDNLIRFVSSSKMNWSFGSTYDNSYIISALTTYLSTSSELKNTKLFARFNLNSKEIETKNIWNNNIFESYRKDLALNDLKNNNILNIEKQGSWSIYYNLNLKYYVPTNSIKSRDEWFFVEKKYFLYSEYQKIQSLKMQEYAKYLSGELIYDDLKYPREVEEYLTSITSGKIWDLVLVYNKVVTNETRDQVALESYIPSWSEIINTSLATESKQVNDVATNISLDRKEFRDNMYFWFIEKLNPWIYNYSYTIRLTHNWTFKVIPSKVSEFYTPEVFGRSSWSEFIVK